VVKLPPNVIALNSWPHAAVMEAWRRCSLALVPSVWAEPFGLVALEAMVAGCPVIAARSGGLCELVVDGETGLLVPPRDPAALSRAMSDLLADPARRERLGRSARARAQAEFSLERITAEWMAFYGKIAGS